MPDIVTVRRALVSVSDKSGLVEFARALAKHGVEIVSTGGTATALTNAGIKVRSIDDLTGFPEILSGRVKTLHPKVHGGLLGLRDDPQHQAQMREHRIEAIDLVCVNLYPFEATVAKGAPFEETIENIDIGGPSMIRSAAKNFEHVAVVTSPAQYERVAREMAENNGGTTRATRAELSAEAYSRTCRYDAAISAYLLGQRGTEFPALLSATYVKGADLRYGENPHQKAALYRHYAGAASGGGAAQGNIATAEQLHGKELSYNNILDASAALELAWALARVERARGEDERVAAAVIKHLSPCGASLAESAGEAASLAIASDPLAAYGGILAMSSTLDEDAAERLSDKSIFLEVIVAPKFSAGAQEILRAKSANVRLLACGEMLETHGNVPLEARSIPGGLLVQERDLVHVGRGDLKHMAGPRPTEEVLDAAMFLEPVVRALASNAVVIGGTVADGACQSFGGGAGQMDRVASCRIAVEKAGARAKGAVAFSDAFFPFADGPQILIDAGVKAIVHPGGSKRDQETFDLCEKRGVTCLVTGMRHFRH